jgi:hypothetical protein
LKFNCTRTISPFRSPSLSSSGHNLNKRACISFGSSLVTSHCYRTKSKEEEKVVRMNKNHINPVVRTSGLRVVSRDYTKGASHDIPLMILVKYKEGGQLNTLVSASIPCQGYIYNRVINLVPRSLRTSTHSERADSLSSLNPLSRCCFSQERKDWIFASCCFTQPRAFLPLYFSNGNMLTTLVK